jgi:hypothetical protein
VLMNSASASSIVLLPMRFANSANRGSAGSRVGSGRMLFTVMPVFAAVSARARATAICPALLPFCCFMRGRYARESRTPDTGLAIVSGEKRSLSVLAIQDDTE